MRAAFLYGLSAYTAQAVSNNGMDMVLDVLKKMHAETGAEQEEEKKMYQELRVQSVKDIAEAQEEIKHLTQKVEAKAAEQAENESEAAKLAGEIETLKEELAVLEVALRKMRIRRKNEHAEYVTEEADLSSTVNQLGAAIQVLQDSSVTLKPSFIEEISKIVPAAKSMLQEAMMQPQASKTVLESTIGPVISMFKELHKKLSTELSDLRNAEANSKNAFSMMEMSKLGEIENNNNSQSRKQEQKGAAEGKAGAAEKVKNTASDELSNWKVTLEEKEKFIADNTKQFQANQALREKEMTGIEEALEILGGEATAKAVKNVDAAGSSFLQIGASLEARRHTLLSKVANMLVNKNSSNFSNSSSNLALVSMRIMEGGPFDKIIDMISNMITTLEETAAAEQAHFQWCEEEKSTTKKRKEEQTAAVDDLNDTIDGLNADIAELQNTIKEEAQTHRDTTEALAARTKLNDEIMAETTRIITENEEGVKALSAALSKLREAGLGFFVQTAVKQAPIKAYAGGDATGPVATLEIIQQDMAELASNKKAERSDEKANFAAEEKTMKKTIKQSVENKNDAEVEQIHKEGLLGRKKKALGEASEALRLTTEYFGKVNAMCNPPVLSYEEKTKKREEEIAALQDALKILNEQV